MVKAEWGTKRACPKCNTRFYDLGVEEPVTCISCGHAWVPEPVLKSKQTMPFEAAKPETETKKDGADDTSDDDLDIDTDDDDAAAPDVDLGDDDEDLVVVTKEKDEES